MKWKPTVAIYSNVKNNNNKTTEDTHVSMPRGASMANSGSSMQTNITLKKNLLVQTHIIIQNPL